MAKLQLKFAVAAREENRYHTLDEREVASSLQDWLKERHSLPEETAAEVADKLAETWRTGVVKVDQAPPIVLEPAPELESEVPGNSSDSRDESGPPAAKIPRAEDRRSKCVVVELPGAIFRLHWMGREFRNCQEYPGLPDKTEYTHVCRLCWPSGGEGEDSAGETSPALSGDGEALVIGSSYSSWDIPIEQRGSQDIEGDE